MACLFLALTTLRLFPVRSWLVWEELPAGFGAGTGNGQKLQPWAAQWRFFWSGLLQRWQNVMNIQPKTFCTGLTFPIISQGHSILHILKIIINDFYNLKGLTHLKGWTTVCTFYFIALLHIISFIIYLCKYIFLHHCTITMPLQQYACGK